MRLASGSIAGPIHEEKLPYGFDPHFTRFWLRLTAPSGFRVDCGLLVPRGAGGPFPGFLVLAGRNAGKRAIEYVTDVRNVVLLALDYGYEPRPSYTVRTFLGDLPEMRRAALAVVPSALLALAYLKRRPDVDASRIALLGYSFGAPLVPCIAALDRELALAGMIHGGGGLRSLIAHNVRRSRGPAIGQLAGLLGGALLRPVDPMRFAAKVAPTPLLMVNGAHDTLIPHRNAEMLYRKARDPKKIVWLDCGHIGADHVDLLRRITRLLRDEMLSAGLLDGDHVA